MALFHTTVLDNQIKALPTVDTASGSIATFDTDMSENLVEVKCQIVATQSGSGTPSPDNQRPITVYTSLNLSHSGADTSNPTVYNIPFGQTVANGVINVTTGKLRVTHKVVELDENWYWFKGGTQPSGKTVITTTNFPSHISDDELSSHFAKANTAYIVQMVYGDFMLSATGTTGYFCYKNSDDGTVEEFKQYIVTQRNNGTPIQVYYKLATPQEIQLDSITLQALLNENNIWCDTGDTEVKYLLTVGKKIS